MTKSPKRMSAQSSVSFSGDTGDGNTKDQEIKPLCTYMIALIDKPATPNTGQRGNRQQMGWQSVIREGFLEEGA